MSDRSGRAKLLAVILFFLLTVTSCGGNDLKKNIIGKWQADLGDVMGLGTVTEYMEFYDGGTVSARTEITNYVGEYKFLDDSTIRIDWQEQGLFGNSPTQILKVSMSEDRLTLTDESGSATTYIRPEALGRTAQAIRDNPIGKSEADLSDLSGRIVFSLEGNIAIVNANGTNLTKLTSNASHFASNTDATWSNGGDLIAFSSSASDPSNQIYVMSADGTNLRKVTDDNYNRHWGPSWSPDNQSFVYVCEWSICTVNVDGSNVQTIIDGQGSASSVAWSPDGKFIVYSGNGMYIANADGSNARKLTERGGGDMDWSPDSQSIVFASSGDIYKVNVDGTNEQNLTSGTQSDQAPDWSPDGKFIVFASSPESNQAPDLYVMNADGSNLRQLTNSPTIWEAAPSWGP